MSAHTFVCTIASPEEIKPFEFIEDPKTGTLLKYYVKARPSDTPVEIVRSIYAIRGKVYGVATTAFEAGLNLEDVDAAKAQIRQGLLGERNLFQSEDESNLSDQEYVNRILRDTEPVLTHPAVYEVAGYKRGEENPFITTEDIEGEREIIERYNLFSRQVLEELINERILDASFEFVDESAMTLSME